jgi:hypothetical protein
MTISDLVADSRLLQKCDAHPGLGVKLHKGGSHVIIPFVSASAILAQTISRLECQVKVALRLVYRGK